MKTSNLKLAALALFASNVLFLTGCNAGPTSAQAESENDPLAFKPAPDVSQLPVDNQVEATGQAAAPEATVPLEGEKSPAARPQVSPALADVVKLVQSDVDKEVIMSYIRNSPNPFSVGAEQMNYLDDLGVPNEIALAMIQHDYALAPQTPSSTPPASVAVPVETPAPAGPAVTGEQTVVEVAEPPPVTEEYFYSSLSPYGNWVEVEGYGRCWQPTVVYYQSDWQPYCDNGHWVFSNRGWYWVSDYSWGATFHYGRWFRHPRRGWCWTPDTVWGPAWVTWRQSSDYCGWAPLPPRSAFVSGVGLTFNGVAVSLDFGFGLDAGCYTFVPRGHFFDHRPRHYAVPRDRATQVLHWTTVVNNYGSDDRHHVINGGIPRQNLPGGRDGSRGGSGHGGNPRGGGQNGGGYHLSPGGSRRDGGTWPVNSNTNGRPVTGHGDRGHDNGRPGTGSQSTTTTLPSPGNLPGHNGGGAISRPPGNGTSGDLGNHGHNGQVLAAPGQGARPPQGNQGSTPGGGNNGGTPHNPTPMPPVQAAPTPAPVKTPVVRPSQPGRYLNPGMVNRSFAPPAQPTYQPPTYTAPQTFAPRPDYTRQPIVQWPTRVPQQQQPQQTFTPRSAPAPAQAAPADSGRGKSQGEGGKSKGRKGDD